MATPFLPDESLDEASLATLIDYLVEGGCDGILILGVLGEADKLSDAERDRMVAKSIELSAGRLQVSVGITHNSTTVTRARALACVEAGAAAVMVSPPPGTAAGPALKEHFRRLAADLPIPFIIQDHPKSSVKLEDPPTAPKMKRLLELAPGFQIFGGLGGVSLLHELDAGSSGAMTGFALPEILVAIVQAHQVGDRERAQQMFEAALPLVVFEAQPGGGGALRKELPKRR